jgi:hypothetical protein
MNESWAFLASRPPFFILIEVWWMLTRGTSRGSNSALDLMRESIELQKKTNACLEEIKAELKSR